MNELKSMLAHVAVTYDVALEQPGKIPEPEIFGTLITPNRTAKVMFRKRR